jgi:hypothetical protein
MIAASEPLGFNDWEASDPFPSDESLPASSASTSAWADASETPLSPEDNSEAKVGISEDTWGETSTSLDTAYNHERELRDLPWTSNVEVRSEKETRDAIDDNVRIELRNGES